jgi:threonyl-tRNA synthetase
MARDWYDLFVVDGGRPADAPDEPERAEERRGFFKRLREHGVRVEVDASDDRMQKKIRNAQKAKIPFMLIAGEEDIAKGAVSFRYRDGSQENGVPVDKAIAKVLAAIEAKAQV